ncbi:MAG TPA: selenite/tellurite reduction operon porin ExtI [Anaeromyxobacter sp.]
MSLFLGLGVQQARAAEVAEFWDAGFLRIDYQLQARLGERDQMADPSRSGNTYDAYVRRNRLSFIGAANETFGGVVQLEYNGGQRLGDVSVSDQRRKFELVLLDAYATADPASFLRVRVGKTKHVLTREVQEGCFDPLSIDRSPFILGPFSAHAAEKTTRDVGLMVWGNVYDSVFQYRLAVMQGNRFGDTPEGIGFRYTGRVHVTFFDKEAGSVYKGTYVGKKRVLTLGAGYELQPNAVYASEVLGVASGAQTYRAYTYDLFYEHPTPFGTFTVSGAYLKADFGEAAIRGVADAQGVSGERSGYYWKAGYMLGPVQVFGRYEKWSFASLSGVVGQQLTWLVGGVNFYAYGDHLRLTLEASSTRFQLAPATDFATVLFQTQVRF